MLEVCPLLRKAYLLKTASLIWSLMDQSPLLRKAHLLKTGLSDLESHGSVSSVAQGSLARDGPLSDLESHGSVSSVA